MKSCLMDLLYRYVWRKNANISRGGGEPVNSPPSASLNTALCEVSYIGLEHETQLGSLVGTIVVCKHLTSDPLTLSNNANFTL